MAINTAQIVAEESLMAVYVRRGYKHYGHGQERQEVLQNFNITVRKGEIYGLLGASGCGKTTLLSCIMGVDTLNSGELWVLGGSPGSKLSKSPGPSLGYQPQQNALYSGFTTAETLKFFGWLCGLNNQQIDDKAVSFRKVLSLPSEDRIISSLSGGELKRVSLAVALLSDPELLVLDEPTVGVDSILRDNIWKHLRYMVESTNTTVIISTHYIEEANFTDTIGFMRGGRLLVQCSPKHLLNRCGVESLEEAFVKLCSQQNLQQNRTQSSRTGTISEIPPDDEQPNTSSIEFPTKSTAASHIRTSTTTQMKALLWKNCLWLWRNSALIVPLMFTYAILPHLIGLSFGRNPNRIPITVVNLELQDFQLDECSGGAQPLNWTNIPLSCEYLRMLDNDVFELESHNSSIDARQQVINAESWAMVIVGRNFSNGLRNRLKHALKYTPNSSVEVYQDMSVQPIAQFVQSRLLRDLQDFMQLYAKVVNHSNPRLLEIPLIFEPPIYGSNDITLTDFTVPGVVISLIYLMGISIACVSLFIEKAEQIEDRLTALGVSSSNLLAAHFLTHFGVVLVQSVCLMLSVNTMASFQYNGSLLDAAISILLPGICGISTGFFFSTLCHTETQVMCMVIGTVFPIYLVSGTMWPTERMHWILKAISPWLPVTKATDAFRALSMKNLPLSDPKVYEGVLSSIAWIAALLLISILILFLKQYKCNR